MLGLVALFLFFSFSFFFSLVRWTYRCARAEGRDKGQSTSTSYETIKRKSKERHQVVNSSLLCHCDSDNFHSLDVCYPGCF